MLKEGVTVRLKRAECADEELMRLYVHRMLRVEVELIALACAISCRRTIIVWTEHTTQLGYEPYHRTLSRNDCFLVVK
eukprot:scaffold131077_cov91-Cyclotella_meneghiniana.AAC.3